MPPLVALQWSLQELWPLALLPVVWAASVLGYRRTTPPLGNAARLPLVLLRALAFTLLVLVLASPVLTRERQTSEPARIAVLVDESASMASVDGAQGPTRHARARAAVSELDAALRPSGVELEVVPFAATAASPMSPGDYLEGGREPRGASTNLMAALEATAERLAARNLQALVLLSDGRPTQGEVDPGPASGLGRPVFTVGIGDTLPPADLAIGRCDFGPLAYVDSEARIGVRLENVGFRGRSTTLRLLQGERELYQRRVGFEADRGRMTLDIPLILTTPGRQRYRVVLEPLEGEFTTRNNAREISIEVLKNRIRVLMLAARPDWDVAFIARTLRDDPNVQLQLVHLDAEGRWQDSDSGARFDLPRGDAWQRDYDLFVVASTNRELLAAGRDLASAVHGGRGLWVLCGREDLLAPGAAVFAPLLPLVGGRSLRHEAVRVQLAPQGRYHPVTQSFADLAGPAGELDVLPPVLAQHEGVEPRPGALVLLGTTSVPALPLLAVGTHGEGQVAVLNGSPIWRWAATERAPVREATLAFVAALVRHLTQPRDLEPVQVVTSKPVYESGEDVDFVAQVLGSGLDPVTDASVQVEVQRLPEAGETVATTPLEARPGHAGEYGGSVAGLGPGDYEARALVQRDGKTLGQARVRFTVDAYSAEFADPSQDVAFLRELASRSGGRYLGEAGIGALAGALPREPRTVRLRSETDAWDTAPYFVLFVLALGAEWLLRKRHGLL